MADALMVVLSANSLVTVTPVVLDDDSNITNKGVPAEVKLSELSDYIGGTVTGITNSQIASNAAIALSKLANVAAGSDGLTAGTIQAKIQDLYTRVAALEAASA